MISTQYIKLNMTPGGVLPVLYCSQYDVGRPLGFVVHNGGEAVDLTAYTCTIEATRTDGTAITTTVTSSGTFATTATMTNKADRYFAQLVLVQNGQRVASLPFVMCVVPAAMDENSEAVREDVSLFQQFSTSMQSLLADVTSESAANSARIDNLIALQTEGSMQGSKITTFVAQSAAQFTVSSGWQSFSFCDYSLHYNTTPSMSVLDGLSNPVLLSAGAYVLASQSASITDEPIYINLTNDVRFYNHGYLGAAPDKRAVEIAVNKNNDAAGDLGGMWLLFTFSVVSDVPVDLSEITDARVGADGVTYLTLGNAIRMQVSPLKNLLTEEITDTSDIIEQGFWSYSQGTAGSSPIYVRTYRTVNEYAGVSINPSYNIGIGLLAYDGTTYIGAWNNNTKAWEKAAYKHDFDATAYNIYQFEQNYPTYTFKLTIRYYSGDDITPNDVNGKIVFEKYYDVGDISEELKNVCVLPVIRNGSDNNAANTYMVSLLRILPYKSATSIKIIINRPVSAAGNKYLIRFDTYTIEDGLTQYSVNYRVTIDKSIEGNTAYIRKGQFDSTSIGFGFSINEIDQNGNNVTLRTTNFAKNDVVIIYDYAEDNSTTIPYYWKTYIDNKINSIKQLVEDSDDAFVFVTDIHVPENQMHSPDIIKYINSKIAIPNVFNNGDYVDSNTSRRAALDVIDAWVTKTESDWRVIRGNHDNNYQGSGTVTEKDFAAHATRRCQNAVTLMADNRTIYTYDNEQSKIRYIFLDTVSEGSVDISDQVNWMKSRITELSSEWGVIVVTHMYFAPASVSSGTTTLGVMNVGSQIKAGIDAVYDTAQAKIIGYICGHCHRDYYITTEKGYPIISTTCDAGGAQASYWDINYPTRTVGTTNEQAFDIYGINKNSKTITALRIGAGATSRSFTYA